MATRRVYCIECSRTIWYETAQDDHPRRSVCWDCVIAPLSAEAKEYVAGGTKQAPSPQPSPASGRGSAPPAGASQSSGEENNCDQDEAA